MDLGYLSDTDPTGNLMPSVVIQWITRQIDKTRQEMAKNQLL